MNVSLMGDDCHGNPKGALGSSDIPRGSLAYQFHQDSKKKYFSVVGGHLFIPSCPDLK